METLNKDKKYERSVKSETWGEGTERKQSYEGGIIE